MGREKVDTLVRGSQLVADGARLDPRWGDGCEESRLQTGLFLGGRSREKAEKGFWVLKSIWDWTRNRDPYSYD